MQKHLKSAIKNNHNLHKNDLNFRHGFRWLSIQSSKGI